MSASPLRDASAEVDIYVSTGAWQHAPGAAAVREATQAGIVALECSGGPYSPTAEDDLYAESQRGTELRLHNYFPPPEHPFVLNLASLDPDVGLRSVEHVERALRLSARLGSEQYGVHAGFRVDPKPAELGRRIARRDLSDASAAWDTFIERVCRLHTLGSDLGVELLIENNVLSTRNLESFGENPLFVVTPDDAAAFASAAPGVRILLDVAHAKVSGATLGFDPKSFFRLGSLIGAYHLSDNDGTSDSNEMVEEDSWFWFEVCGLPRTVTLEVYEPDVATLLDQVSLTRSLLRGPEERSGG